MPGNNHWLTRATSESDGLALARNSLELWPLFAVHYSDKLECQATIDLIGKPVGQIGNNTNWQPFAMRPGALDSLVARGTPAEFIVMRMANQLRLIFNGNELLRSNCRPMKRRFR